jgi:hypothetical protein
MSEQIFQLVERNLEARQLIESDERELKYAAVGDWMVKLYSGCTIFVKDGEFQKHFTSPKLPWHPQPPMPHWYRPPDHTDIPLTIDVVP